MTVITTPYASMVLDPALSKRSPIVVEAHIIQEDESHDIAVVRIRSMDPTLPCFASGTPVQLSYGWNPVSMETFYGYVNHVVPEHQQDINPTVAQLYSTVVCIGASYGMRDTTSLGAWIDTKASALVITQVKKYHLSAAVEADDSSWSQLSNPGWSDWRFVAYLANKLGWSLAVNKTNLRFLSLEKILKQYSATMPTFWTKFSAPSSAYFTINSFRALQGETAQVVENTKAIRTVSNVDRRTGQIFTAQSSPPDPLLAANSPAPLFHVYDSEVPSGNLSTASYALANISRNNRFYIQAEAAVAGNVSVTQGTPVLLLGLGSTHSGVWYVHRVEHCITPTNYLSKLQLGRDGTVDNGLRPVRNPAKVRDISDLTTNKPVIPPTVLVNNNWRAAYSSVVQL